MGVGHVFVALIVGLAAIFLGFAVAQTWFHVRLKANHSDVWRSLGEPMPIVNLGMHNHWKTARFLRLREYEKLSDPKTRRIAAVTRILYRAFLAYAVIGSLIVFGIIMFVD